MSDSLQAYKAKRNFSITPEPSKRGRKTQGARVFVIQKHWASRLHYDFRIELGGTMKSWAVPKGPSLDPKDKRMAVQVEDHPISYNSFEGEIPENQYGAGKVIIWDQGIWEPRGDPRKDFEAGNLKFALRGQKLQGNWALVRMKSTDDKKPAWLLIKEKDEYARPAADFVVVDELPDSVVSSDMGKHALTAGNTAKATVHKPRKETTSAHGMPTGAEKRDLPKSLTPQLATLMKEPPVDDSEWQYEIKFDGYRLLTRVGEKSLQLFTRSGNDWTCKLPALAGALANMRLAEGWYDGEIVVLNDEGMPDFQRLQNAFDRASTDTIVYYLFDVPFYAGYDLRRVTLLDRREILASLFNPQTPHSVRFSHAFEAKGKEIRDNACHAGFEGVIGKRVDSTYSSRRSSAWIKLKCHQRQEFVIGGYTDPQGARNGLGSLLLGVQDERGSLHYAGNVGTGFDGRSLETLHKKLQAVAAGESPFSGPTGGYRKVHWVKPQLVAEVTFAEWTAHNHIRHAVFHALRTDKPARSITREKPGRESGGKVKNKNDAGLLATQKVTHPERIIDPATGTTKIDLMRYYALVAPHMLAHLKGRPISMLRAPDGLKGQLFMQKHLGDMHMKGVKSLSPELDPGHLPLVGIDVSQGLLSAVQMNVLEFHVWNALKTNISRPDRFVLDLDPGDKTEWGAVQLAAELVRTFLQELELESLLKTSGGKGLHVVVPIKRLYEWGVVKDFTHAIVNHLAQVLPRQFVAKSGPKNRIGKIFVDYLRNGFGATTVAAWSARARPGLGVSVPIAWRELEKIKGGDHWNVGNIQTRLDRGNKPWEEQTIPSQALTRAMKILGYSPPS